MALDDDTSPIPARFEDAILDYASILYATKAHDNGLLTVAAAKFKQSYSNLEQNELPGRFGTFGTAPEMVIRVN
jgi:hypothetical protein